MKIRIYFAILGIALAGSSQAAELIELLEFEGNFNDSSASGNPTTADPGVIFGAGNGGGQAAVFASGVSGTGLTVPIDINTTVNPNITIGAWVNASAVNDSSPWGHDAGGWDRGISTAGFGDPGAGSTWGISNGAIENSGLPVGGGWQFIAATYRDNIVTLNVDGTTYTSVGNPGPGGATLSVGTLAPGGATHDFDGSIDNFFIYDDALTAKQLQNIRLNGVGAITQTNSANIGPRTVDNTWNFESGDLTGWNIVTTGVPGTNDAFTSGGQPAVNANSDNANIMASAEGAFHVRTWDGQAGGLGLADAPTGVIRTDPFVLGPNAEFDFLIGGGHHPFVGDPDDATLAAIAAFNLEREVGGAGSGDWEVIFSATGRGGLADGNLFRDGFWDAGLFEGENVRLALYDTTAGGWGHIDLDDVQYSTALTIPEPAVASLLGLLGLGLMFRRRRR